MKYLLFIFISGLVIFSSCQEKEVIIPPWQAPTGNKTVLVEELTGVGCTNCPTGAEKLANLQEKYDGKLIVVGIHGGFLTKPLKNEDYDLRNDFSKKIETLLLPWDGKPAASIDRTVYNEFEFAISSPDSWAGYIEKAFKKEVSIDLALRHTWDEATRKLSVYVDLIPQKDVDTEDFKVSVMLVESGISTTQKSPTGELEEYEHHNVLRTMLTYYDGDLVTISANKFEPIELDFYHTLAPEDGGWVASNMQIIAFVSNAENNEVIQTKKIAIVE